MRAVATTIAEKRFAVKSEMSNCRSDVCSPMSSSDCSSSPEPVRFDVLVHAPQRHAVHGGVSTDKRSVFCVVVSKVRNVSSSFSSE